MERQEALSEAIVDAMPGWTLNGLPQGFGWAPQRHFQAVLRNGPQKQDAIIRQSWGDSAFQTEKFLYETVLDRLPLETPRLLGDFMISGEDAPWMILEKVGNRTVADEPLLQSEFIRTLGLLHGHGKNLLIKGQLDSEFLKQFPANHGYCSEWQAILRESLRLSKYALPASILSFLSEFQEELSREPLTLLHGDTDPSNAIVTPTGIALVDWERASIGPACVDLGRMISCDGLEEDIQSYRLGYNKASECDLSEKDAQKTGNLGLLYDSFRWTCHYIKQVEEGNDPGKEWKQVYFDPCLELIRATISKQDR